MAYQATIDIQDPVFSTIDGHAATIIRPHLSYEYEWWQKTQFRKVRRVNVASTMFKAEGGRFAFFTGFLDRVCRVLNEQGIGVLITADINTAKIPYSQIALDAYIARLKEKYGFDYRPDQYRITEAALADQRGVMLAPTGTGKTTLGGALISAFEKSRILWLCHTKDLMDQAYESFRDIGISTGRLGGGMCELHNRVLVATRQSMIDRAESLRTKFEVLVIDEVHHVSSFEGEYATILRTMESPVRFGLTATLPEKPAALLAVEGFVGPLIDELSVEEAADLGIIAIPRIRILRLPKIHAISELKKYNDVYEQAIVHRRDRNQLIIDKTKMHNALNESVLTFVTRTEHGQILERMSEEQGLKTIFLYGKSERETRLEMKKALFEKNIHSIICSVIWKEGINIPSLDAIINASGGKSDTAVLQTIGRGLRVTDEKKVIWFYDFFDPSHRYLVEHFGYRISLYSEMNWL